MPKKFLRRYLPDHRLRTHRRLQLFGQRLHDPNLWHLNRRSASGAVFIGLFNAFIPLPVQMILSAAAAIMARVNLPIAVGLVWITNPITIPPMFYFCYRVGAWLLDRPIVRISFELSPDTLATELSAVWQPLLLGCLLVGLTVATAGSLLVRLLWRLHIVNYWKRKKQKRALRAQGTIREST